MCAANYPNSPTKIGRVVSKSKDLATLAEKCSEFRVREFYLESGIDQIRETNPGFNKIVPNLYLIAPHRTGYGGSSEVSKVSSKTQQHHPLPVQSHSHFSTLYSTPPPRKARHTKPQPRARFSFSSFESILTGCSSTQTLQATHTDKDRMMMSRSHSMIFGAAMAGMLGHTITSTEALRVLTPSEGMTVVADR